MATDPFRYKVIDVNDNYLRLITVFVPDSSTTTFKVSIVSFDQFSSILTYYNTKVLPILSGKKAKH